MLSRPPVLQGVPTQEFFFYWTKFTVVATAVCEPILKWEGLRRESHQSPSWMQRTWMLWHLLLCSNLASSSLVTLSSSLVWYITFKLLSLFYDLINILLQLSVIVYGLYLTIASSFCPNTCLPGYLPIASLAASLGRWWILNRSLATQYKDFEEVLWLWTGQLLMALEMSW